MLSQHTVTAVISSDLIITDKGARLRLIGNRNIKVGDKVWTDGQIILGNRQTESHPLITVPIEEIQEELIIPIMSRTANSLLNPLRLKFIKNKGALRNIHTINKLPSYKNYFLASGVRNSKKKFALVNVSGIHPYGKRSEFATRTIFNVTMASDGNIYTSFDNSALDTLGRCIFKNYSLVWTPDYVLDPVYSMYSSRDIKVCCPICIDRNCNAYCVALVYVERQIRAPLHENAGIYWGDQYEQNLDWVFIAKDQCTLMWRYHEIREIYNPEQGAPPALVFDSESFQVSESTEQPFESYSLYLPCQNEGKGGWYSFDCVFKRSEYFQSVGAIQCTGLKFFNRKRSILLFELTADDFEAAGLSLESYILLPYCDFCRLGSDDFLILIRNHARGDTSGYTSGYLLRYKNKKLSLVEKDVWNMCSVVKAPLKNWRSAVRAFSKADLDSKPIVIA